MQFLYHTLSGKQKIDLVGDDFKYIAKVKRHKNNSKIYLRNLQDSFIYEYVIVDISKKSVSIELLSKTNKPNTTDKELHIGWCIIDNKVIEKNIIYLNQMGVQKVTFINCDYSQNNFKISLERLKKILINSSMQCGRSSLMQIDLCKSIDEFLQINQECYIVDFDGSSSWENINIKTLLIGCEGGFSQRERELFGGFKKIGFNTPLILKSETAVIGATSKILL